MIHRINDLQEPFLTGIDYSKDNITDNTKKFHKPENYSRRNNISINPLVIYQNNKNCINLLAIGLLMGISFTMGFISAKTRYFD
jgi:hypothetical protein